MIMHFVILFISVYATSAAVLQPSKTSMELINDKEKYSSQPIEILPIQPILLYPSAKEMSYQGRALLKDNEIIYIKLLKRKSYRPKKAKNQIDEKYYSKEIQMRDIFYVKALTNGQFSHNRLKLYRLPEFYAITVYKGTEFKK